MAKLGALCVYFGSSEGLAPEHRAAAAALGRAAAERDVRIVFGGGRVGLMGILADAALNATQLPGNGSSFWSCSRLSKTLPLTRVLCASSTIPSERAISRSLECGNPASMAFCIAGEATMIS